MSEITANVNWLAVIVGAVLAYALGWLWYSPKLFGAKWAEGVGAKTDGTGAMPVAPLILQAIGTFLLSWIVGVTAARNALATAILIAATFMVLLAASAQFTRKSNYAMWTEVSFVAAMVALMIAVQAAL